MRAPSKWADLGARALRRSRALGVRGLAEVARAARHGQPQARIALDARISGPGSLRLGPGSSIGAGSRIYIGPGASLELGQGSRLNDRAIVNATVGVRLLDGSRVSWDVQILDSDFHSVTRADGSVSEPTAPIIIGERSFIGANSMILKGVRVGEESVVGAGSVVTKDVEARTIVAGNPARIIGRGTRTDLRREDTTTPS